jgi:hypothetical protein
MYIKNKLNVIGSLSPCMVNGISSSVYSVHAQHNTLLLLYFIFPMFFYVTHLYIHLFYHKPVKGFQRNEIPCTCEKRLTKSIE